MKKQVRILKTIKHPKGDVVKGSVYNWDKNLKTYVLKNEMGIIYSTANEPMVEAFPDMFEYV